MRPPAGAPPHDEARPQGGLREVLAASAPIGPDLLAVDWDAHPLGPIEAWPQSLQAAVRIMISSRFSMWMAWGPELTFFCNDAYRRDTLGVKYPWALGRPAREVWAEIWDDIGPRIDTVLRTGVATWDEALLLFLERSGFPEETYHTFSYSPLADDEGRVSGMLCVVSEDTERVVGARRVTTLRDLGSDTSSVTSEPQLWREAGRHLSANLRSLPFTLTYLFGDDGGARLVCATGVERGHAAAPATLSDDDAVWPAREMAEGSGPVVIELAERFADLPAGDWPRPPVQALVLPLAAPGQPRPFGFFVAALNRYRPLDGGYRDFLGLVAGQLAARLAAVRAYEAERARAESLAELDRAKTAFFTNVSHELRTPLTLLLGPVEDALSDTEQPLSPRQRERAEVSLRSAQRLLKLVNTLLDFSRLESGRASGTFEPTDLARYTADLASMFESAAGRAGLAFDVEAPTLPELVYVDREMWAKVVLNLLSNALKFTFEGGIRVEVRAVDGGAEVAVTDTGIGVDAAEQERLFERFHRVAGAHSRSHEGTGIGLALVAELAALHGGSVSVSSRPGEGSRFAVRVPFGSAHLPPDQLGDGTGSAGVPVNAQGYVAEAVRWLETPTTGGAPTSEADEGRPSVLVVDDNADMRDYVTGLLAGTCAVRVAVDGAEALAAVRAQPPDLVLSDVMMPNLDGFGLLTALRSEPATAGIPVILLSARAGEEGVVEGLHAGADDYLTKPFSARELLARVHSNLELDRARRARVALEHRQELLDEAQRLAAVGSWEIDLATGGINGSPEYFRLLGTDEEGLRVGGLEAAFQLVHPDDVAHARAALDAAREGADLDVELRLCRADGDRLVRVRGELVRDGQGSPVRLRGSLQDITDQRAAELASAAAEAARVVAAREHRIADELQASLLPQDSFHPDHLEVANFYQAGVEGTQVGGDWYDVIELGAGRTALVIGDVMGRGVRAAAVMGQLRAAVRAYARLDLSPGDVLALLDEAVSEIGTDQIVTCIYAVYDPHDHTLTYANAGHLPPLVVLPGGEPRALESSSPPLGASAAHTPDSRVVHLVPGALLTLYTDGLVEQRDRGLDEGIQALADELSTPVRELKGLAHQLVERLLPRGPDDDIAILVARVPDRGAESQAIETEVTGGHESVAVARTALLEAFRSWRLPAPVIDDAVLCASELVTNALLYGQPPIDLRARTGGTHLFVEVHDAGLLQPRRLRATDDDEHGRGLQILSQLADRWGTRPSDRGKAVWCSFRLAGPQGG